MPLILDEIIIRRNISKRKFARMLGIDGKNINRLFKPTYNPDLRTLEHIAKTLKLKVRSLFRG